MSFALWRFSSLISCPRAETLIAALFPRLVALPRPALGVLPTRECPVSQDTELELLGSLLTRGASSLYFLFTKNSECPFSQSWERFSFCVHRHVYCQPTIRADQRRGFEFTTPQFGQIWARKCHARHLYALVLVHVGCSLHCTAHAALVLTP